MSTHSPTQKTDRVCPRCGLVFSSERVDGLCPACLIANTFDVEAPEDGPAFWEDPPAKKAATPARTFSHFELLDELGRGGMGVVYRARDLNTERIVALKVLQAHHLDVPDLVLRFRSEVRAVSSLDHPYVLPIHEVGEHEGIPFFSMKLTTGGSLAHSIGTYLGKPKEAAQLLAKVARGVQHAHERGILHRDLKPGNILIDAAGEPYVCDFGLAKWIEDDQKLTVTAAVLGTPHYIAPEQALGSKALTIAVDIYSLGAILYELLTGRPPFVGATVLETLVASQDKTPDRPSSLAKNVPADLETICLKALEHNPSQRYATAGTFAEDLENYVAGRPITARPVNAAEQLWRWAKRNPLPALLVVALFVTVLVIAIGSVAAAVRIEHARERAVSAEAVAVRSARDAEEKLYESLLAQARASRLTGRAGQKTEALAALTQAAKIHQGIELENEAISVLGLYDLRVVKRTSIREAPVKQPVAFDSSLASVYVGELDGTISRRDFHGETHPFTKTPNWSGFSAIYSSGDKFIIARHTHSRLAIIGADDGKLVLEANNCATPPTVAWLQFDVSFSTNEERFAFVTSTGEIDLYSTNPWQKLQTISPKIAVGAISLSPDGGRLAISDTSNFAVEVWRIDSTPIKQWRTDLPASVRHIAWSDDGRMLAAGCRDFQIALVSAETGLLTGSLHGHRQDVTQTVFSHRGEFLISTSRDRTIRLWDLRTHTQQVVLPELGTEPVLKITQDDKFVSATDFNTDACVIEIFGQERTPIVIGPSSDRENATLVSSMDISPSGRFLATATFQGIDIIDTNQMVRNTLLRLGDTDEKTVRFGDSDRELYIASRNAGPKKAILDLPNQRLLSVEPIVGLPTNSAIFGSRCPGKENITCLTSYSDQTIALVDLAKKSTILTIRGQADVWDAIADPDRRWVAASYSPRGPSVVRIFSASDGRLLNELPAGYGGVLFASPDFRSLLTTGSEGGRIWDTQTWKVRANMPMAVDYKQVSAAAFSPDNKHLAVATNDKIYFLDAESASLLATFDSPILPSQKYRLLFSADGRRLFAQGEDNSIRVWNLDAVINGLREIGIRSELSVSNVRR